MRSTRIVTARVLGDPPPWRAGAAPDCEDARVAARREEMRKHFGVDGDDQLEKLLADRERLKPRRYRAPEVKPADGRNLPFVVADFPDAGCECTSTSHRIGRAQPNE